MNVTSLSASAVDLSVLPKFSLYQDAMHGGSGHREEMSETIPVTCRAVADQPQIGLVNESRGLERLAGLLASELLGGQLTQLVINHRQEETGSCRHTLLHRRKDARNVVNGLEPVPERELDHCSYWWEYFENSPSSCAHPWMSCS